MQNQDILHTVETMIYLHYRYSLYYIVRNFLKKETKK